MDSIEVQLDKENINLLNDKTNKQSQDVDIRDDKFSYEGYQVVRREFFAHVSEPSITFNNCRLSLNTACLKRLTDVDYVQILVNPDEKKLAIRPSNDNEKDSFLWCNTRGNKRRPRQITCRIFFAKIIKLMDWNLDYRYKILGKLIQSNNDYLFIFDLTATEVYQRIVQNVGNQNNLRVPIFPAEWQHQFGLPVEEHRKLLQVNIFNGYTVFGIKDNPELTEKPLP